MHDNEERDQANRQKFAELLARRCTQEGANPAAPGLNLYKHSDLKPPVHGLYNPSICVIAQGAKEVLVGDERLRYDAANFLVSSLDVPVVSRVIEATPEVPYLGLKLEIDPSLIASVAVEAGLAPGRPDASVPAMAVSKLQGEFLDAFVRLIRLLDNPGDYQVVSPLVMREIIYRLLISDQGPRLRQMTTFGGSSHRITKAVHILKAKFNEPLSIEELAGELGMSVSSFHQHFKTATSMSPLQFQKLLRLQEARRLLLTQEMDASSAAVQVGYEDPSQFTREYKRLFGDPPMRDVARFKGLVGAGKA